MRSRSAGSDTAGSPLSGRPRVVFLRRSVARHLSTSQASCRRSVYVRPLLIFMIIIAPCFHDFAHVAFGTCAGTHALVANVQHPFAIGASTASPTARPSPPHATAPAARTLCGDRCAVDQFNYVVSSYPVIAISWSSSAACFCSTRRQRCFAPARPTSVYHSLTALCVFPPLSTTSSSVCAQRFSCADRWAPGVAPTSHFRCANRSSRFRHHLSLQQRHHRALCARS